MKIGMVLYDPQEFGGLEEIATTLAIEMQRRGQHVIVFSATWVPPDNQYICKLCENGVPYFQIPKWLSYPASHWPTKEKILNIVLCLLSPFIFILSGVHCLLRQCTWKQSLSSTRNFLRGFLMSQFIGPDLRQPIARLFLYLWHFRWHPDLYHLHGYATNLLFAIEWAHAIKIPVVYEQHQTPDPQFDRWQDTQRIINKADIIVAVSEKSAQALRYVCGVTQPIVVANPIVQDPFTSGFQKNMVPGHCEDLIFVTTVARLTAIKGLKYLLEAIVQVKKTYPDTQFRVFGDGPLRQELLAYANELGLEGNKIFVGSFTHSEELANIMASTDIFVMSSILEGQPLGIVEAMAYGRPIVATSVGGIPELIQDGFNGLMCSPGDPACLACKILQLIEDPALRTQLGQAARISYEQGPFQPDTVTNDFISIFKNVLQLELGKYQNTT